jgi:8-oxo-dGTP pyrophosphatase MutT (NUDIX family)
MSDDAGLLPPPTVELINRARAFRESGAVAPEARTSATVVLLRDGDDGLEVFMLRRLSTMAFGAGAHVFPGGVVDAGDRAADQAGDQSAALVNAAVRETSEETGVLLDPGSLRPWSRWITPHFESRRYDTVFYVGVAPSDQIARHVEDEADAGEWISPSNALAAQNRGEWVLMPPTEATVTALARYQSASDVLNAAADRDLAPLLFTIDLDVDPPRWQRT